MDNSRMTGVISALMGRNNVPASKKGVGLLSIVQKLSAKRAAMNPDKTTVQSSAPQPKEEK